VVNFNSMLKKGDSATSVSGRRRATQRVSAAAAAHDATLRMLAKAVPSLAVALGSDSEVVLHDLRKPSESIVAVGGKLTGRAVGSPVTDLVLYHLRQGRTEDMLRYQTRPGDGRVFRSSTIFLRDDSGAPFACLCFNTDLTAWHQARDVLNEFMETSPIEEADDIETTASDESFVVSVSDLAATMLPQAIDEIGVPVEYMQKHHKLSVVRLLEARGLFLVRDAVETTARALGVTKFTIYNYLNEIRSGAAQEGEP
jgi:predicted transcriptional regulator YheO